MPTLDPSVVVLYSTNTSLKFRIQEAFYGGRHHAWCSPAFDSRTLNRYAPGAGMPPPSDPWAIYHDLQSSIKRNDQHCAKIKDQTMRLIGVATKMEQDGKIDIVARDEIISMVGKATLADWRPLVYVIPTEPVRGRIIPVPVPDRASLEPEWIVPDLKRSEFDILEFNPP